VPETAARARAEWSPGSIFHRFDIIDAVHDALPCQPEPGISAGRFVAFDETAPSGPATGSRVAV
jgi:hypothetical protein